MRGNIPFSNIFLKYSSCYLPSLLPCKKFTVTCPRNLHRWSNFFPGNDAVLEHMQHSNIHHRSQSRFFFKFAPVSPTIKNNSLVATQKSSEDLVALQKISRRLLKDSIVSITEEESQNFCVSLPRADRTPFQQLKYTFWDQNKEFKQTAWKFVHLILERLENEPLTEAFSIDESFNARSYFYILHLWFLHQRLIKEEFPGKMIDESLFEFTWTIFRDWLLLKNTPEHLFENELRNCQSCMLGFCLALDSALEQEDTKAGRVRDILQETLFVDAVSYNTSFLDLLTKYIFRQRKHLLQVERSHFLLGFFIWADVPTIPRLANPKVIAPLAHRITYGGYLPEESVKLSVLERGKLLPLVRDKEKTAEKWQKMVEKKERRKISHPTRLYIGP
ncbi:putative Ubiquinol-cytochrome c chaperone [Cardiosporidium cionae]|uniref:Ubiquinol-cytochrome c chaperone n=1 Tax=Cardiosporidium cionae TaxID=476202 RepID=A0ABQ7JC88_9APIC|nr:putative Ubiquinol-cytochrome c chaperone [Cardiosporidium cionae]|eukprot:KAF8821504.1 putative Ubiquinol-cytochrome c chaperone [Cardiosporidium cionae]